MQRYILSPVNPLSDRYEMDEDGKHYSVVIRNSLNARLYGGEAGRVMEFLISGNMATFGMGEGYGPWVNSEGESRSMDIGEMDQFYKEVSRTLKHFSTQVLGIGIPESITGMPTRRQVRRDLKEIYTNARAKALEKTEE